MRIYKKIMILLVAAIAIFLFQGKVLAAETVERTTPLDITGDEFDSDQSNEAEGWKWERKTKTLTLTDVNFNTGDDICLKLIFDADINIVLNGTNHLTSNNSVIGHGNTRLNYDVAIIFQGNGELIAETKQAKYAFNLIDMTVKSGTLRVIGGSIFAFSSIKIEGGNVIVDTSKVKTRAMYGFNTYGGIKISGGTVDINSLLYGICISSDIQTYGIHGLNIIGGNVSINSLNYGIYADVEDSNAIDINTTGTVDFKDCPVGMYLNNGKINIQKGNLIFNNEVYEKSLNVPKENITIADADYTKVNEAIAKKPADLSIYTDESVQVLNDAIDGVVFGKNLTEQSKVNMYATSINSAINALELKPADYTKVNEAIAKKPADLSIYTDESVQVLNDAIDGVVFGKNLTEQSKVNMYATSINSAINALELKPADYTKVNEVIAKIPTDLSMYTDESVQALNDIKNAFNQDKKITEQTSVNEYANLIEKAINDLKAKDAENTNVDEKSDEVNSIANKEKSTSNSNVVKTGDNIVFTSIIFVIALTGTLVMFKLNKKINKK